MSWSLFRLCLGLALCALNGAPAGAEAATTSAAEPATQQRARVVLVGAAGRDTELSALLRELLTSRGVEPQISARERFDARELLQSEAPKDGVHVFIVPGEAGGVRLYFRAPDGERFLLRSVLLRSGFDDLGRELLGQIVETAVASLLHSTDGLTRAEAQAALATDAPDPPDAPATSQASAKRPGVMAAPPAATTRPRHTAGATTALDGWLAFRYGATALGGELDPAHGLGLELGVGLERRGMLLRGRVLGERDFRQALETTLVAAQLDSLRLRLMADAGVAVAHGQHLLVSLGVGQDRTNVKPQKASGSSVAPAGSFQNLAPVAHAELRYEVGSGWLRLAGALGADVALVDTHYDVARPGGRVPVVTPWLWRPTASVALAFCPRWATF